MTKVDLDSLLTLAGKIENSKHLIKSEEHTKMAYIMPFIQLLGYDVNSPFEVIPEYTCDFGVKKGEKVDYCIVSGNKPYILVECKDCRSTLTKDNISQLYRYFSVSSAKLAILTNGIDYMLFTDSVEPNKMDIDPFYSFNLLKISEKDIDIISMLHKDNTTDKSILSFSRNSLCKQELENWVQSERNGISKSFIDYIRRIINTYDITNNDLAIMMEECIFNQYSERSTCSTKVVDTEQKKVEKKAKQSVKTATGICGVYTLGTENIENDIAGSYLCFIGIYDAVYNYTQMYKILYALIDFVLDTLHFTVDEIISKNSNSQFPSFYKGKGSATTREYRGVSFRGALSAKMIIQIAKEQCNIFEIAQSVFRLGLLDKETKANLDKLGIDPSYYKTYLEQRG